MFAFDKPIFHIFTNISNVFMENGFHLVSFLFDPFPLVVLVFITSFVIYFKCGKKELVLFLSAVLSSILLVWFFKYLFGVDRPVPYKYNSPSFPSAHSTISTAYFLILLHLLKKDKDKLRRILHYFFCILSIVLVGVSRLYLGVHWLSDVLAGYVLGGLIVYFVLWFESKLIKT